MAEFLFTLPDWLRWFWDDQPVKAALVMLAVCAQVLVTLWTYNHVGKARMQAGRERRVSVETYRIVREEPEDLALKTRALANQFELPVLFYASALLSLAALVSWLAPLAAWMFVALRVMHLREMLGENRVMRRRQLFFYGMVPVLVLLAEIAFTAFVTLIYAVT